MILFFLKIWTSVQASHITARDRLFSITRTAASTAFAWQDIAIMVPIAGVCILHQVQRKRNLSNKTEAQNSSALDLSTKILQ